ncbi:MAG: hypothetical protein MUF54_14770 [Polyangiaceae bacterium]|jgi:hypothetical protein|nr:hypothetical protein [Polyangiaceae bacterium]
MNTGLTLNLSLPMSRLRPVLDAWDACLGKGWEEWLRKIPPPLIGAPCPTDKPCRYFACRWHMAVEWNDNGNPELVSRVRLCNQKYSCLWDIIEDNPAGLTEEEIAKHLSLSHQAVSVSWIRASAKFRQMAQRIAPDTFTKGRAA